MHGIPWLAVGVTALGALCLAVLGVWLWSLYQARGRARARRGDQISRWNSGLAELNAASEALMAFELDCERHGTAGSLARASLGDVTEPATAEFYAAFNEAQALRTDAIPTDDDRIAEFVAAARTAWHAFKFADDSARRKAQECVVGDSSRLA